MIFTFYNLFTSVFSRLEFKPDKCETDSQLNDPKNDCGKVRTPGTWAGDLDSF